MSTVWWIEQWAMVGAMCVWIILGFFCLNQSDGLERRCPTWVSESGIILSALGLSMLIFRWADQLTG